MTKHWQYLDRAERIAAIIDMRDAGKTKAEIAAALHVTVNALHGFAFRQEIKGLSSANARTGGWYDLTTDEKRSEVERRLADGQDLRTMAHQLGLTVRGLRDFCNRRNGPRIVADRVVKLDKTAAPEVADKRPIRPDAWTPLAPPVGILENTGCCWPVEGGYCGAKKGRRKDGRQSSYCEHHHAMAYPVARPLSPDSVEWLAGTDARAIPRREQRWAPPREKKLVRLEE